MAIVLYLEDRKLPEKVKLIFKDTLAGKNELFISVVSLMEIGYLFEKKRIDTSISNVIKLTLENKNFSIRLVYFFERIFSPQLEVHIILS